MIRKILVTAGIGFILAAITGCAEQAASPGMAQPGARAAAAAAHEHQLPSAGY